MLLLAPWKALPGVLSTHFQGKLRFCFLCDVFSNYSSSRGLFSSQNPFWIRFYSTNDTQYTALFISFAWTLLGIHLSSGGQDPASPCTLSSSVSPPLSLSGSHRLRATLPSRLPRHPFPSLLEFPSPCAVMTYHLVSYSLTRTSAEFLKGKDYVIYNKAPRMYYWHLMSYILIIPHIRLIFRTRLPSPRGQRLNCTSFTSHSD